MAIISFPRVQPGDLITSTLWNNFAQGCEKELQQLEERLAKVEAASGADNVVITGHSPPGVMTVNQRMTITGRNFSTPHINNIVKINATRVPDTAFRFGSSDTTLVFDIPEVPGLAPSGTLVTLTVQNDKGRIGTYDFTLRPREAIPEGRIEVTYITPPVMPMADPNIRGNQSYIFGFRVTAIATQPGTYRIQPSVSSGSWTAELLEDTMDTPRPSNLILLPASTSGITQDIRVRVTIPDVTSGSTTLTVDVTEITLGSQVNPGNQTITITVGSAPPAPETRARLSLRSVDQATIVGNRIQFQRNQAGAIVFNVAVTQAGRYTFQAQLRSKTGWEPDPIMLSINQARISAGNNQDVSVILTPGTGAANTDLILTVSASALTPPLLVNFVQGISVV